MTGSSMEICPFDQENHPASGGLREAFAHIAQRRCGGDVGTQGRVQREWDLSADEAKGLIQGKTSIRTMEKVLQHKNGGWRIGLAVLGIVIGRRLTDYFASEKKRLNHEAEIRRRHAAELEEVQGLLDASHVGAADRRARPGMGDDTSGRLACLAS